SRSKRALATGNGLATVVMFVLHKQVRLRRRLNVKAVAGKAARRLAPNIDREYRSRAKRRR
ncbi:MAG: hypothetical protein GY717_15500, partial [Rhodobacteraceae bacterium]|nr:hypothetical protein [Paracoccaceae bacterium]